MKLKKPNTIVRTVCAGAGLTLCCLVPVYATGGDPLTIVNNLSDFIFPLSRPSASLFSVGVSCRWA